MCPAAFSLVVVEGVPKALKRYHKLMLRRIKWAEDTAAAQEEAEEEGGGGDDAAAGDGAGDKPANSCHLVWEVSEEKEGKSVCGGCGFS